MAKERVDIQAIIDANPVDNDDMPQEVIDEVNEECLRELLELDRALRQQHGITG